MAIEVWLALVVANTLLFLTPGPTMLLVLGTGIERGGRAGLVTVSGGVVGACLALLSSLLGIGAVLAASTTAFTALKLLGAAYLLYLAVRAWRAPPAVLASPSLPALGIGGLLVRGFFTALLNPKAIAFHVAFVPQFIDQGRPIAAQLAIILATFAVQCAVMDGAVALLAGRLRHRLLRPATARIVNRLAAGALFAAGLFTLTLRRSG